MSTARASLVPVALQARMRAWLQDHPTATLLEMEVEVEHQLAAVRADLLATIVADRVTDERPACPSCGTMMWQVGQRTRTVRTRGGEPLTVRGNRYRCSACGAELFPPR